MHHCCSTGMGLKGAEMHSSVSAAAKESTKAPALLGTA